MENSGNIKHIVILVSPHSTVLDMSGPMDVFQKAIEHFDKAGTQPPFTYKIHTVSLGKSKKVRMSSGITILTEGTYKDITYPVDTLIVAGRSPPMQKNIPKVQPLHGSANRPGKYTVSAPFVPVLLYWPMPGY